MQRRKINRVVDLISTQSKAILNLDCGHNPSISLAQIQMMPLEKFERLVKHEQVWDCNDCPDPTPATERQKKTAQQLYREAGEPDIR